MNNRKAWRRRPGANGFTLMELLVVISIISLLMSITLPALTGAREQGKRVACMSNMRNLTQCWIMYAMENDDRLCSADTDWDVPPKNHWVADGPPIPGNTIGGTAQAIRNGVLWPYTGEELGVYKCHSDRSEQFRSYAISVAMNGPFHPEDPITTTFRHWSGITRASQRMVFVDAQCWPPFPWLDGPFMVFNHSVTGGHWNISFNCATTTRHSDGCNLSLADGHCEYWRYRDPRTIAQANHVRPPPGVTGLNPDRQHFFDLVPGPQE